MLLVIFGAGASHGSADSGALSPPLAKELLDHGEIARRYPASRSVIDYLRRTMNEQEIGLEEALEQFDAMAASTLERRQQLVAFRFYLCQLIGDVTGAWLAATHGFTRYLTLFNYLREWQEKSKEPIRLVTFNYDTLIEEALTSIIPGWRFDTRDACITRTDWTLYKLHGSITWSRVGRRQSDTGSLSNVDSAMEAANQLEGEDLPIEQFPALSAPNPQPGEPVYFPALAVPIAKKTTFECPPIHVEALESAIPEVRRLLICGWKAAEQHMVQMLQGVQPRVLLGVVSGNEQDLDDVHGQLGNLSHYGRRALDEPGGMQELTARLEYKLRGLLAPLD